MYIYANIYAVMFPTKCNRMHPCIYIYLSMYMHLYIYIHGHIYIHTHSILCFFFQGKKFWLWKLGCLFENYY